MLRVVRHLWKFNGPVPKDVEKWAREFHIVDNPRPCPKTIECRDDSVPGKVIRHIFDDMDYTEEYKEKEVVITDNVTGEVVVIPK